MNSPVLKLIVRFSSDFRSLILWGEKRQLFFKVGITLVLLSIGLSNVKINKSG